MSAQIAFLVVTFVAVLAVGLLITALLSPGTARERVRQLASRAGPAVNDGAWIERITKLGGPLAKLSVPDDGWDDSSGRIRFMNAGYRHPSAPLLYFAAKTALAILFPALAYLTMLVSGRLPVPQSLLLVILVAAALGYYLPNVVLAHGVATRQRTIFESLPNAIDLMTVCVEAGLGLDAALLRVADESSLTTPALAEELRLVSLELRAGASKERALRNLALRTGVEEVDAFVAMLVQAERFGTSIADSLRIHSDALRTARRLRAEEAAAKIAVKLVFPLIFCIFPAMLLVLGGPAILRLLRVLPSIGMPGS